MKTPYPEQIIESQDGNQESLTRPELARKNIMQTYYKGVAVLKNALEENRNANLTEHGERDEKKPKGTVVVSLWEEDEKLLTTKMFEHSLQELLRQAKDSGLDLDIVIVANNGGGSTPEIGKEMIGRLIQKVTEDPSIGVLSRVNTLEPSDPSFDASTPWEVPLDINTINESTTGNRVIFIEQEFDPLNKGKIRAVRDAAYWLTNQIVNNGYTTDFVFQMDAETILEYKDPKLAKAVPPLKAMFNQLTRKLGKIAVGTKDRFAVMDPDTGKPLDVPVGSAQRGFEVTNTEDKFISLPGGALMSRPENYLAAMVAISRETPSMGVEDYTYTKILREAAKQNDVPFEDVANSMGVITHLNRTPPGWKQAIAQMANWRSHAGAADKIFPGDKYNSEPLLTYIILVVQARFADALKKGPQHLLQLLRDFYAIPHVINLLSENYVPDVFTNDGGVSWTLNSRNSSDSVTSIAR